MQEVSTVRKSELDQQILLGIGVPLDQILRELDSPEFPIVSDWHLTGAEKRRLAVDG
jgi:hypothetical protein